MKKNAVMPLTVISSPRSEPLPDESWSGSLLDPKACQWLPAFAAELMARAKEKKPEPPVAPPGYRVLKVDATYRLVPCAPPSPIPSLKPLPNDGFRPLRDAGGLRRVERSLLVPEGVKEWVVFRETKCWHAGCSRPAVWWEPGRDEFVCRWHAPKCECGEPGEVRRTRWRGRKWAKVVLCGDCAEKSER